jgi:hypothetical protein
MFVFDYLSVLFLVGDMQQGDGVVVPCTIAEWMPSIESATPKMTTMTLTSPPTQKQEWLVAR